MPTKWNLVDNLSDAGSTDPASGKRREFYLPLASIPPGLTTRDEINASLNRIQQINPAIFEPSDLNDLPNDHPIFQVVITPPNGGFSNDSTLPDPAIRLHAISEGLLTFRPDDGVMGNRLLLKITPRILIGKVEWFRQWIRAGCIPHIFIYENVDRAHLETLISNVPILPEGPPTQEIVKSQAGLSFPQEVTRENKDLFIERFLTGGEGTVLSAEAGAFIGMCSGFNQSITPENNVAQRMIKFHAHYADHQDLAGKTHFINPRELLHLIYGIDSHEYNHIADFPFLASILAKGEAQTTYPVSKRMLLRPPLRTFKRVIWEAEQEVHLDASSDDHLQGQWGVTGRLSDENISDQPLRLYNTHQRVNPRWVNRRIWGDPQFKHHDYHNKNKCNVFVSDVCLRAGFRIGVGIVRHGAAVLQYDLHYIDANSYTNTVHKQPDSVNLRQEIPGESNSDDSNSCLGFKLDNWIGMVLSSNASNANKLSTLNEAMVIDGRCIIISRARARRLKHSPGGAGDADPCRNVTIGEMGHIAIVEEFTALPVIRAVNDPVRLNLEGLGMGGSGLYRVGVNTIQATNHRAERIHGNWTINSGEMSWSTITGSQIRLHVFELCPGKDPDTNAGLKDLNVLSYNWERLTNCNNDGNVANNEIATPLRIPTTNSYCADTTNTIAGNLASRARVNNRTAPNITASPPAATSPIARGSVGNTLSWTISNPHAGWYIITQQRGTGNKYHKDSGVWVNNVPITINIDGLSAGNYSFRLYAFNDIGIKVDTALIQRTVTG